MTLGKIYVALCISALICERRKNMARRWGMNRLTSVGLLGASLWLAGMGFVQPAVAQAAQTGNVAIVKGLPDFTELVEQVGPSVVNIRSLEKTSAREVQGFLVCHCLRPICHVSNVPTVANPKRLNPKAWVRALSCPRMVL
jgi:S1-C subfamily serine protease